MRLLRQSRNIPDPVNDFRNWLGFSCAATEFKDCQWVVSSSLACLNIGFDTWLKYHMGIGDRTLDVIRMTGHGSTARSTQAALP
jgi:hypothetical protein